MTDAAPVHIIRAVGTRDLPTGTVTFVFTDVEGSTKLLHALGPEEYAAALAEHRRAVRSAAAAHGGVEVDTQGDAFFLAFPTAPGALAAAREATAALATGPIRIRIGLHTGTPLLTDEGYVGPDVHTGARIAAAGHGGQVLVSAASAALVDGSELRDLGLHRLKDLTAPERIYQLGTDDHPPLKTLHHTNLPVPATPFLGRAAELAAVGALIARPDVRLVTLTGPGGTGKTRLALQAVAEAADHFPDGVWWVPLAALRDPALVIESAATALGASGDLAEHIGDKQLLLLLDNFEHLVTAAAELAPLLAACPHLTLVVTSREPLHLAGEWEYAVDPLVPADAVELFLTRALAARRDVAANGEVAAICERLDHLPLAIELAAARVKVLSPAALLARLEQRLPLLAGGQRDAPERQRTLRATIEWSHELLTPDEQRLFARLAVFRGGWTLEAAEQVAEADLDTLHSLVDKSLVRVRPDSGRFWMLETIREFAVERLDASGESDDLRQRHAEFFLALAEEADAEVGATTEATIRRLTDEHDNLRAALDRAAHVGDHQIGLNLAGALWKFWYQTGYIGEGRRRLESVLATDPRPTPARARALNGATSMAVESGDSASARRWAEEALEISRSLEDPFATAHAQFLLANVTASEADWEASRRGLEASRETFRAIGNEYYTLLSGRVLAWVLSELGEASAARSLHEENLRLARESGNERIEAMTLGALAWIAIDESRLEDAAPLIRAALRMWRKAGDRLNFGELLLTVARLHAGYGRPELAARVLSRSTAMYEEMGAAIPSYDLEARERTIATIRETLDETAYARAWAEGRFLSDDEVEASVRAG